MLLKILIAVVFIAMLISLAAGAGFLLRSDDQPQRLLLSLKIRVALAVVLLGLLLYGFYMGELGV
ncbi:DUF2909 domain-containing protein [Halomonas campisalis]|uniref:DUF2909 domain-containing protein n=1 Tax=Billgrantia campisalis TaxID=74661 RepID=A0ABS9P5J8_9GAMM|nr:DUF2909 family protein [Halomonas campisalis]MCG6657034.1 DUF2909 domain-containing protein [Halomonas campisalis]MDR5862219.1 DUF2909 family protein [Halomonas campisalis]